MGGDNALALRDTSERVGFCKKVKQGRICITISKYTGKSEQVLAKFGEESSVRQG